MAARRKKATRKKVSRKKARPKSRKKSVRKKSVRKKAVRKKAARRKAPARKARRKTATPRKSARKKAVRKTAARAGTKGKQHWSPKETASALQTVDALEGEARRIYRCALRGQRPELKTPQRSLKNVSLSKTKGYLEIGRKRIVRSLTYNTVRTFAQTLKFMALSKEMIGIDDLASKREVYYQ